MHEVFFERPLIKKNQCKYWYLARYFYIFNKWSDILYKYTDYNAYIDKCPQDIPLKYQLQTRHIHICICIHVDAYMYMYVCIYVHALIYHIASCLVPDILMIYAFLPGIHSRLGETRVSRWDTHSVSWAAGCFIFL